MANAKEKQANKGAPVQGDLNTFSGFEKKCTSGKSKKAGK